MAGGSAIEITVEQRVFQEVGRRLLAEADGKKLRRDLGKQIRRATLPIVAEAKSNILGMADGPARTQGMSLRAAIARDIKVQTRYTGRSAGARIRVTKKRMPRGFRNAPKRLNSGKGWRHPVFGSDTWVRQSGRPGWFDNATRKHHAEVRRAVLRAMKQAVDRIGGL